MAAMFTVKDLEVYKDSLKEKQNKPKAADKPPLRTPPSGTKLSKPPLKPNIEEPLKERKPLSVVHKASNTIKYPLKPSSPTPVGSSKQADQSRRSKETTVKSLLPGKTHTSDVKPLVKAPEYKSDALKSPKEALPSKSPQIKLDDGKNLGVRKSSTHASPVYQKSPSLSGATPTVDMNASLCSECIRSASEGAVCFIGNDGRVSACTTRSAVRLCKNLNCAANNPEYVAAMAKAPKKYLISKRHLLKAQFAPKSRSSQPKSPSVDQSDAAEPDATSPSPEAVSPLIEVLSPLNSDRIASSLSVKSNDADLSPLGGDVSPFDDDMRLFNGNSSIEKDDIGLQTDEATRVQDVNEHDEFSFHDVEAAEPESPKLLVVESSKDLHETHFACGIESSNEDAESLAIENFEEPDDEDFDGSPLHRESKAEELFINYGDLMPSEEADVADLSGNAIELTQVDAPMTEIIDKRLPTDKGENGRREGNQTSVQLLTTDCDKDGGNSLESILSPTAGIEQVVVDNSPEDGSMDCKHLADDNNDGCFDAGQVVDDSKIGDFATLNDTDIAHDDLKGSNTDSVVERSGDLVPLFVADGQGDDHPPFHELDGVTTSPNGKQVNGTEDGITLLHGAENEQRNDDISSVHDNSHEEYEDESDEDESEGDTPDAKLGDTFVGEENVCNDALERKEETSSEMVAKDQCGGTMSTRRQRRRRVLRGTEEVSPETVILRKQQMLERKQAEEWMLNHAIEGVVHKLAPTGEAKVKILVEAFETIISHPDVEIVDSQYKTRNV